MKYIFKVVSTLFISALLIPISAFAATSNLKDLANSAVSYFNMAIEVILGLAVVVFVFNIYRYFFLDRENKERGMYLLWSIIGFAVILCFWGLVNLLTNTFNLNNSAPTQFGNLFGGSSNTLTNSNSNPFDYSGNNSYGINSYSSASNISNPFSPPVSSGNHNSGSNSGATHTTSNGAAANAANSGSNSAKGACSKYFNICISNSSGARGTILKDSDQDFDLLDQKDGIMIALIYSKELSFNGSGSSFTNVSLLGQKLSAYKRSANGVTQVITGTQTNGSTLIVMLVSKNDISASRASAIIGSINLNK